MTRPARILLLLALVLITALLAWAWVDGGRRPLTEISQTVAVPESAK